MRSIYKSTFITFIVLIAVSISCKNKNGQAGQQGNQKVSTTDPSQATSTISNQEKKGAWTSLFDGKTTDGWRLVYGDSFPSNGWEVHDGVLTVLQSNGRQGGGEGTGSIVTDKEYANFELKLDFKLTKGANSGIKYFVVENPDFFDNDPAGRGIGLEYQVLDDANHPDAKKGVNGNRTVGSLYDMIPAAKNKKVKSIGEWNHARIVSDGNHVEHWLNGQKVLEYERGGDAFNALVDKSKYNHYKNFGLAPKGHILLQDHGNKVSYRNIKIRTL